MARLRRAVVAVADRQEGVVALTQLQALGVTRHTVDVWVASRWLQRIHQGVYAVGHRALRREGYWMAAVLACGSDAVLSHRSAGALHGLCDPAASRVDVTVPRRVGRSRSGIRVHSGDVLYPDERDRKAEIPCTSVARTILDLAGILDARGLERVVERAVRVEAFDLTALNRLRARHGGRRGVARLRAVLEAWDPDLVRCRSELEVLFLRAIVDASVERPLVNQQVWVGERSFEVDFHWPDRWLVVETDDRAFHDTPLARKRDSERDELLASAGWTVKRFRWPDVTAHLQRTLATVRAHLSRVAHAA